MMSILNIRREHITISHRLGAATRAGDLAVRCNAIDPDCHIARSRNFHGVTATAMSHALSFRNDLLLAGIYSDLIKEEMMKKSKVTLALALMMLGRAALAQTTSPVGPDRSTTHGPGDVNSSVPPPGTVGQSPATTPSAAGDASTSGASTAAGATSSGSRTEPGAVQSGTSR